MNFKKYDYTKEDNIEYNIIDNINIECNVCGRYKSLVYFQDLICLNVDLIWLLI